MTGLVQKSARKMPSAATATAKRRPEQSASGQEEEFPDSRGELRERRQRSVHAALQHFSGSYIQHGGARVHLEPGVHLAAVGGAVHFLVVFVHAAFVSDDLHASDIRLRPRLRGLSVLLWRHGVRLIPGPHAPSAVGPSSLCSQPHEHQRRDKPPQSTVRSGLRSLGPRLQLHCSRLPGL